jgi:antitoxin component YwqK of YwqJK toxin-antitoxin module
MVLLTAACSSKVTITEDEMRSDIFYKENQYRPFSGKCMVCFRDTSLIKERFSYKKGILNGEAISWYRNGQMKRKGFYDQGLMSGKWEFWDAGGHKTIEAHYRKGIMEGPFKAFGPDGNIIAKGSFAQGKRTGPWTLPEVAVIDNLNDTLGNMQYLH